MKVEFELDEHTAKLILMSIPSTAPGNWASSNKDWAWWRYEAAQDTPYNFNGVSVRLVQTVNTDHVDSYGDTDSDSVEMVWEFFPANEAEASEFYQVKGTVSSYGDDWSSIVFKRVTPTEKVIRLFV